MQQMIVLIVLYFVVGLVLADPSQQLIVNEHFDAHDVQGWSPHSMVVDSRGYMWFTNTRAGDSILQLNPEGEHVASLRTRPAGSISNIALGGNGELLYLADNTNRRILLTTIDKQQIVSFPYTIPLPLKIQQIAVDDRGTIYMIDDSPSSLQVWRMNADGSALPSIISDPPIKPACIAIDPNNVLYVADQQSSQILQFSSQGDQIGIFSSPLVQLIIGLAIDEQFNLYISDYDYQKNGSVTKLSPDGIVLGSFQQITSSIVLDDEGSLYVADLSGHITKLNSDLQPMNQYYTDVPTSVMAYVSYDFNENELITISINDRTLMRFHPNGTVKSSHFLALDNLVVVSAAVVGKDNQLYVYAMDGLNNVVLQLSKNGTILAFTQLNNFSVSSFAIGADGTFYMSVNDDDCQCVIVYSRNGKEIKRILPGVDPAKMFSYPVAIHVDVSNSSLYVLDPFSKTIYHLSATDVLLWSFNLHGYVTLPSSFAVDSRGNIYVTDRYNSHFIHIMRSGDIVIDYQFDDFSLFAPRIAIGADDIVYLADSASRILILTPKLPTVLSSDDHTLMIVLASVGSFLLIVVGTVLFRLVCIKQPDDMKREHCGTNSRHVSRRGRSCRRGARVNFLHNYHDNLRHPVNEEDSADYVLYI